MDSYFGNPENDPVLKGRGATSDEKETKIFRSKNKLSAFKYVFYNPESPDFYDISKKISNYEKRKINLEDKIKELENANSDQAIKELKKLYKN